MSNPRKAGLKTVLESYEVLGLPVGGTPEEIKTAYRKLVKIWHPDVCAEGTPKAEKRFKAISAAFDRLRSASIRELQAAKELYQSGVGQDGAQPRSTRRREARRRSRRRTPPPAPPRRPSSRPPQDERPIIYSPPIVRRGRDVAGEIELTPREEIQGARWKLELPTCRSCGGWGLHPHTELEICAICRGLGLTSMPGNAAGKPDRCRHCVGRGCDIETLCDLCGGTGSSTIYTVRFSVAAGLEHGFYGFVEGLGHPGVGGAPPGDLYILVV